MAPRTILYTGKGGVGKTSVAAATARRCAAAGLDTIVLSTDPAHCSPTPLGRADRRRADAGRRAALGPAGLRPGRDGAQLGGGAGRGSASCSSSAASTASAPRSSRCRPASTSSSACSQLKRHHDEGRFDVRRRRLRADRRDAAAALVPRRRALVAARRSSPSSARCWPPRGRSRAPCSTSRCPATRCSTTSQRLVRNLIAMNEILRDTERASRAAGDDARPHGRRRGAAHVHLPEPLRLPDRRRRGQPRLPRTRSAPTSAPGASASSGRWPRCESAFAPVPVLRAPYFGEEVVGAAMLDRLGDAVFGERDAGRRPARPRHPGAHGSATDAAQLRLDLPFAQRGRRLAQEDRPRARRPRRRPQAHAHAAARAGRLPPDRRRAGRRRPARDLRCPRRRPLTRSPTCASACSRRRRPPSASPPTSRPRAGPRAAQADRTHDDARGDRRARARAARARAARAPAAGHGPPAPGPAPPARAARLVGGAPRRPARHPPRPRSRTSRWPEAARPTGTVRAHERRGSPRGACVERG